MFIIINLDNGTTIYEGDNITVMLAYTNENMQRADNWTLFKVGVDFTLLMYASSLLFDVARLMTRHLVEAAKVVTPVEALTETFYSLDNTFAIPDIGGGD